MPARTCFGPNDRRAFLRIGALAYGGLTTVNALQVRADTGKGTLDTSVILLYLHGGPSQLETYDLKPLAPTEYRSVFRPITTNVPGIEICELFPLQAKLADKFSLIRSLHHDVNIHSDGGIVVWTGKRPSQLDPTSQSKSEHPDLGSVVSHQRGLGAYGMLPYVAIPQKLYMTRPAYLGGHHGPLELQDPSRPEYAPPILTLKTPAAVETLMDRRRLLASLDRWRHKAEMSESLRSADKQKQIAFELLTSSRTAAAFDLGRESDGLRDRYGRHLWGQGCLLARRLAEAGVGVISLYIDTPKSGEEFTNWDDHILNAGRPGHFANYMKTRLPYLDQALSALIEDIFQRGLDEQILVVVMGEFGRTPRLSQNTSGVGRDHWPDAYTALVSGGGLRMGQVVGQTNPRAEFPISRPCSPQDLLATIYRHLGIDTHDTIRDLSGRPVPILAEGRPISELVSDLGKKNTGILRPIR